MNAQEFVSALNTLGWTIRGFARVIGWKAGTVGNWTREGYRVPANVAEWLRRRVRAHSRMLEDDPPPGPR